MAKRNNFTKAQMKAMRVIDRVSLKYLRECFDFDAEAGTLKWKVRPAHHFPTPLGMKIFNAKYPGEIAGTLNNTGYLRTNSVGGGRLLVHIVIWTMHYGKPPEGEIDHKNGTRTDNRITNFRDVSKTENQRNRRMNKNNTSGCQGVSFHPTTGKWQAQISIDGKKKYIGLFLSKDVAIKARKDAEIEHKYHPNHGKILA